MRPPRPIPDTRTRRFDWDTAYWFLLGMIGAACLCGAWCVGRWT